MADTMNAAATHATTFRLTADEAQSTALLAPDDQSGNWHIGNLPVRFGFSRGTLYPDTLVRTKDGNIVRDSNDKVKRYDFQDGKFMVKVHGVKGTTAMTRQELMNKQLTECIQSIKDAEGDFELHMLMERMAFTVLQNEDGERWLKASISNKVAVKADQLLNMLGINS
jgi:hypothetical protein